MNTAARKDLTHIGLFGLVYVVIALLISNSYYQLIMTIVPIWAVMGLSWNLLSGYSGLISFGHAAFFWARGLPSGPVFISVEPESLVHHCSGNYYRRYFRLAGWFPNI